MPSLDLGSYCVLLLLDFRDDFEFVTQVIMTNQQWLSFQFVSDRLREDPTIALSAILQDSFAIQWCRPALKNNVKFLVGIALLD